jgi:flagellar motor switch protein FliM
LERPYRFENIPKLTQAELDLQNSLSRFLSSKPFEPDFRPSLVKILEDYLKVECQIAVPEAAIVKSADLPNLIPHSACIVVVGVAPGEEKIFVEIDPSLVGFVLERLLGGTGEHGRLLTALTEFEEGVISFLLLKIMQAFHQGFKSGQEAAFSLDRIVSKLSDIKAITDEVNAYHRFGTRISYGNKVGYVRILLPNTLIKSFASLLPKQSGRSDLAQMRRALSAIGESVVEGRIIGATVNLSDEDLKSLEPGDIVILENHHLTMSDGGVTGEVVVKLGAGKNGTIRGSLLNQEDHCRLQITEIAVQENPQSP